MEHFKDTHADTGMVYDMILGKNYI